MTTLLHNDVAPVGVWIVVIIIGSVVIVGTVFFLYRCIRSRWRSSRVLDVEASAMPARRLTLREGKTIPKPTPISSKNLKLNANTSGSPTSQLGSPLEWLANAKGKRVLHSEYPVTLPSELDAQSSPRAVLSGQTSLKAPRLSLGSFDDKEPLSSFSSVSDLSVVSKPAIAITAEAQKAKVVNFSRPQAQPRTPALQQRKTRLSVINESTPRNSFINRIVSWASSSQDSDQKKPEMQQTSPENPPKVGLKHVESREDLKTRKSPLYEALDQLAKMNEEASTPELPSRHPSRTTNVSDDQTLASHSRSNSISNMLTKEGHSRSNSANFSRRGAYSTHSQSNSVINFSRPPMIQSEISRSNSTASWLGSLHATLSEPFTDTPVMFDKRESQASIWSSEVNQARHSDPQSITRADMTTITTAQPTVTEITADASVSELSPRSQKTPSTITSPQLGDRSSRNDMETSAEPERSRSRSRSRSRGPVRARSKNGRHVLRKRSLQTPEIYMIGPVDPATLGDVNATNS